LYFAESTLVLETAFGFISTLRSFSSGPAFAFFLNILPKNLLNPFGFSSILVASV